MEVRENKARDFSALAVAAVSMPVVSVITRLALFRDLVLDPLAVGRVADRRQVRLDERDHPLVRLGVSQAERRLHDVVSVGVLQEHRQRLAVRQLGDHRRQRGAVGGLQALLDYVRRELLRRQIGDVALEATRQLVAHVGVGQVHDVLDLETRCVRRWLVTMARDRGTRTT